MRIMIEINNYFDYFCFNCFYYFGNSFKLWLIGIIVLCLLLIIALFFCLVQFNKGYSFNAVNKSVSSLHKYARRKLRKMIMWKNPSNMDLILAWHELISNLVSSLDDNDALLGGLVKGNFMGYKTNSDKEEIFFARLLGISWGTNRNVITIKNYLKKLRDSLK